MPPIKPVIIGVAGTDLTDAERALIADQNPFGLILFRRNCETPAQVQQLTSAFRTLVQRGDAPVLSDEEGGRVARLREPQWHEFPALGAYLHMADNDTEGAAALAYQAGQLAGAQCLASGITVNCAPMCDVAAPGSHGGVIGDRAFGNDPATVTRLARAYADGLLAAGVLPVMKHLPGHGRAIADSHEVLPTVNASHAALVASDFTPFKALQLPLAMTAHVRYPALDDKPATLSHKIINETIRGELGFAGLLLSDALEMKALNDSLPNLTRDALAAGCDAVLYCAGDLDGNRAVLVAAPSMVPVALARWRRAQSFLPVNPAKWDDTAYDLLKTRIGQATKVENAGDSLVARL